ncbi:MAG TPA: STAS domain-containing protein [Dongiaceae bacterium]|nr:STAS domain-containing protein [Dongiaceae bacterium]
MMLQLHKNQLSSELCQLEFVGKLMMGNEAKQVEWNVSELLVSGVKKIIFDLTMLDGIDSTGVGIIVMCQAKLQKAGGSLRVAGAQGIVGDTLLMTHVDRLVPMFATAKEAAQDFVVA